VIFSRLLWQAVAIKSAYLVLFCASVLSKLLYSMSTLIFSLIIKRPAQEKSKLKSQSLWDRL